jgi:hypothetical protein
LLPPQISDGQTRHDFQALLFLLALVARYSSKHTILNSERVIGKKCDKNERYFFFSLNRKFKIEEKIQDKKLGIMV